MVGDCAVELAIVDTVKDADVAPPAIVTVVGLTVAAEVLLLDTLTDAPPDGAWPLRMTVPFVDAPALTLFGLSTAL
jgi:hypothetical protein